MFRDAWLCIPTIYYTSSCDALNIDELNEMRGINLSLALVKTNEYCVEKQL